MPRPARKRDRGSGLPTMKSVSGKSVYSNREYADRWLRGKASEFVHHLPDVILQHGPCLPCWLYVRLSPPRNDDELETRRVQLIDEAIAHRVYIAGITADTETSNLDGYRPALWEALENARQHRAVLLAMSRCRFFRSFLYLSALAIAHRTGGPRPALETEVPTVWEFRQLARMTAGVTLATVYHPDTDSGEIRGRQTETNMQNTPGGRPVKRRKAIQEKYKPIAFDLLEQGFSPRETEAEIKRRHGQTVDHTTIWRWGKDA